MAAAAQSTRVEVSAGEPVPLAASSDTLDFLLKAKTRSIVVPGADSVALVAAPNKTGDQIMLAAPLRTKPGEYTATLIATSATGQQQQTALTVVVKPRLTVPAGSTRPPVVLLNGWEAGFTNSCPVSSGSAATFGNLAQYLQSDGVPAVYYFDNCVEDPNQLIETLGNDLGKFLNSITYDNGEQVPQIDVVGFSIGGLIARAYLAGLQPGESLNPPVNTLIRDLVLIATPNFGSFVAANFASSIVAGSQSAELVTGSSFLWNLATWNERGDDLRGVNAVAIAGNAGSYVSDLTGISLNNASDGIVSLTSASLGFLAQNATVTRIVPYCDVDPDTFTNTALGTFNCTAPGIANVTTTTHPTGAIVRSFLAGNSSWQSIGTTPATDPYLSVYGGMFFGALNSSGAYVTDLTQVTWGTTQLNAGGDQGTIFFNDFSSGTGSYSATSQSLGSIVCGSVTEATGYFATPRCKIDTTIEDVGPPANLPGRVINAGSAITINGADFGYLCNGCQVVATPTGAAGTSLAVSSWTNTSITAQLPPALTGLLTISVMSETGSDSITILVVSLATLAVSPANLQFAFTTGGAAPAAQSIAISNSGTGTLTWTATASTASGAAWLSVTPASGTAPSTLTVSVSPSGLTAGTYSGSITISSVTIPVTLTVSAPAPPPASLAVTPLSLAFQYSAGAAAPPAQTLSLTNTGSGTLTFNASTTDFWLGVSAASGTAPATLSVSVNPANLGAGTYTGTVEISAPGAGSPATISVTLVVQGSLPAPAITGITNAASYQPGFASATWVAIYGKNLSQTTYSWQPADFLNGQLPPSLHGVSVTINGTQAYVEYISPTQINVLAPDDPATGSVPVQVTVGGQASNIVTGSKQQFAPAFFVYASGSAVAVDASYNLIGPANPAQPGEIIQLYGTGFGPTNPALLTDQLVKTPEPLANPVQFKIGGVTATVGYAGLVEAGLYQFNVTVPSGLPKGDAAVTAVINGIQTQTGVSITVEGSRTTR